MERSFFGIVVEGISGIEDVVTQKIKNVSMLVVGAGGSGHVHLSARRAS
jgi:hypothetical protein